MCSFFYSCHINFRSVIWQLSNSCWAVSGRWEGLCPQETPQLPWNLTGKQYKFPSDRWHKHEQNGGRLGVGSACEAWGKQEGESWEWDGIMSSTGSQSRNGASCCALSLCFSGVSVLNELLSLRDWHFLPPSVLSCAAAIFHSLFQIKLPVSTPPPIPPLCHVAFGTSSLTLHGPECRYLHFLCRFGKPELPSV